MYQNSFPPHNTNLGKAPTNPPINKPNNTQGKQGDNRDKSQNYTLVYLDYGSLISCISQVEPSINVINIKGLDTQCALATRRTRLNITGPPIYAPSRPPPSRASPSESSSLGLQYNILEHLGNTLAQISILDLLQTSPLYQEVLNNTLHESRVPSNINATEFCNLVGHLSASCALSFKTTDIPVFELDHILPL